MGSGLRQPRAPEKFVAWLSSNVHTGDFGTYQYHPRSDAHSKALGQFIIEDLLESSPRLEDQAARGMVVLRINLKFTWPATSKTKTVDLAIGPPMEAGGRSDPFEGVTMNPVTDLAPIAGGLVSDVYLAVEMKSVMTEHGKAKPRVFDELSSSHEIVHQGNPQAVAGGVTVVNIAETFVSPLRQHKGSPVHISRHKQPEAAATVIEHLRGLKVRNESTGIGFDAYSTIVVICDNQGHVGLHTQLPAPQPGQSDHYDSFLDRLVTTYEERYG